MEEKVRDEDKISSELKIHTQSLFALQQDLETHAQHEAKYYSWYATACKKVDDFNLEVEITTAEIIEDVLNEFASRGKPIPPSARAEIRKGEVPKDPRYRIVKNKLNNAMEEKNYIFGLVKAWGSRSHRLTELVEIMKRQPFIDEGPYVRTTEKKSNRIMEEMN